MDKSFTEIMLNYASALDAIWGHTSAVDLICYDAWEEFNDSMFYHLVVETLCYQFELSHEEIGLVSLAYPWKNSANILVRDGSKELVFKLFGYPEVDLVGGYEQYFGEGKPLAKVSDMKFSHALCESESGDVWLARESLSYQIQKKA